jgi:alpha-galactosidase
MAVIIAVIGAGSAVFSLNLVRDLCLTPTLAGSTIRLMDIDEARLDAIDRLCARYAAEIGTTLRLEKTTDRREALAGADFVINTALAAGHHRLREGWDAARRLGYRIGGSLHIMHDEAFWINFYQLRLFESLAEDMLALCPEAYLLLVANPVLAGITHLGRRYPALKVVGLCHGYAGVYHLTDALGLDRGAISYQTPGVNHFVWLTHFYHHGENAFPLLDRWIEAESERYFARCDPSDPVGPAAVDLYRRFGAFPIGDTATPGGGSWPAWYHGTAEVEAAWNEDPEGWWRVYFEYVAGRVEEIRRIAEDDTQRVSDHFPPQKSDEVMIRMVEAIACDIPTVLIGNVPNRRGYVPGVPADIAVEIPLLCSARGIEGIETGGLPPVITAWMLRDRIAPVTLELDAYTSGRRDALIQLALTDPYTRSVEQAQMLVGDILALHPDMAAHYR